MRFLILLIFLVGNVFSLKGQVLISLLLGDKLNSGKVEFGLDGGINYPDMRGLDGGEKKGLFNIGFYFDIKTKNPNWMVHTGVLVKASLGSYGLPVYSLNNPELDVAFADGQVQRKINYFNVPFGMKYKFSDRIFAIGAVVPSLRSKAYDIFTTNVQGGDLEYRLDVKNQFHQLDFGVMGGLGYRLMGGNGMNLTVRYYYGLVDVVIDDTTPDQYNTSLYLAVGIPIGATKAKEREQKNKN
jgi:hypothetical protein